MEAYNFFFDRKGHLRSGWRLAIFCVAFLICLQVTQLALLFMLSALLRQSMAEVNKSLWSVISGHGAILISSLILGWVCGALLEELPFSAMGCSAHRGWLKNLLLGSLLGAASLFLAAVLTTISRGIHF